MFIQSLLSVEVVEHFLSFVDSFGHRSEHLLILCLCCLKLLFKALIVGGMKLVEYFHFQGPKRLSPHSELLLDVRLQSLFLLSILVGELPVILGLAELSLRGSHVFKHLLY